MQTIDPGNFIKVRNAETTDRIDTTNGKISITGPEFLPPDFPE
jgi:hypothetical protein